MGNGWKNRRVGNTQSRHPMDCEIGADDTGGVRTYPGGTRRMLGVLDFATDALLEVSPCHNIPAGIYFPS
jgi:hypothetical protein